MNQDHETKTANTPRPRCKPGDTAWTITPISRELLAKMDLAAAKDRRTRRLWAHMALERAVAEALGEPPC